MDIFLILFVLVFMVLAVLSNVKLLFVYQMRGTKLLEFLPVKITIIVSLAVAWMLIMLLPLDVRNAQTFTPAESTLNMNTFWTSLFITACVFLFLILPGVMFWHEVEDDDENKHKLRSVLCSLGIYFFVSLLLLVITYFIFGWAYLPYDAYECPIGTACTTKAKPGILTVHVTFDIYIMAFLCFVGWFIFVSFGGIGLSAFPMGLIIAFRDRPVPIDKNVYEEKRQQYGETATALLEVAKNLKEKDSVLQSKGNGWKINRAKSALKTEFNKLKQTSYMLETEYEKLEESFKLRGENPLLSYAKLILGIICSLVSFLWWLHVIIFVLAPQGGAPVSGFLNDILIAMQEGADGQQSPAFIFAIVFYSLLNIHLLFCVLSGILRVGMKLFCMPIHPMREAKTPLNSFLFNCIIVLLAACAITQFSQYCFAAYSSQSSAAALFQGPIRFLGFFKFFNDNLIFFYIFVILAPIAALVMMFMPSNAPALNLDGKAENAFKKVRGQVRKEMMGTIIGK